MDDDAAASLDEGIGEEIQHLRLARGLSLSAFAAAVGLTHHQVQSYEMGRTGLTVARLCRFADALDVDPSHFLRVRRRSIDGVPVISVAATLDEIGPLSPDDLRLAAKIARIRDDASRRDIIASIDRLVEGMARSVRTLSVAGVTA